MPYVTEEVKELLDGGAPMTHPGHLNYMITMLLRRYWINSPQNYQAINDVVGAVEGAKQEFYWKVARPYEDEKERTNGRIY